VSTGFADLIALAVGQPLRPLEMSGTCKARVAGTDKIKAKTIVIVDNREPVAPEKREVAVRDMLFSLKEIRCRGRRERAPFPAVEAAPMAPT
jgi:hypothetical protein